MRREAAAATRRAPRAAAHPVQVRPYREEDPLTRATERGEWLLQHLSATGLDTGTRLLDIGCGYGGLSLAYARSGRTSYAVDSNPANLAILRDRIASGESGSGSVVPVHASALALPLGAESADLV